MERPYWTFGSRYLCIRTNVPGKVTPDYEMVAQVAEPADDPKYSKVGNWDTRAEQIAKAMNAHDDLVEALRKARGTMKALLDADKEAWGVPDPDYQAQLDEIDAALAKAGA